MVIFICSEPAVPAGSFCWFGLMHLMKNGRVRSTVVISFVSWPRNFSATVDAFLPASASDLGGKSARVRPSAAPASSAYRLRESLSAFFSTKPRVSYGTVGGMWGQKWGSGVHCGSVWRGYAHRRRRSGG